MIELAPLLRKLLRVFGENCNSKEAFTMDDECFEGKKKWCTYTGRRVIIGGWYIAIAHKMED